MESKFLPDHDESKPGILDEADSALDKDQSDKLVQQKQPQFTGIANQQAVVVDEHFIQTVHPVLCAATGPLESAAQVSSTIRRRAPIDLAISSPLYQGKAADQGHGACGGVITIPETQSPANGDADFRQPASLARDGFVPTGAAGISAGLGTTDGTKNANPFYLCGVDLRPVQGVPRCE